MKSFFAILPLALFVVLAPAELAFAIQTHGEPEGLYAHQLAHLFFILCMGSFAYRIHRSSLPKNQGWQLIALGSILLTAWNLWAFTGHYVTLLIPADSIILPADKRIPHLHIASWKEILYYVLNMDHLLCVPALLFLYLGLRRIGSAAYPKPAMKRCE